MNKKVQNGLYRTTIDIGAGKLKQVAWYFTNVLFFKNSLNVFSSLKVQLLRIFGARIGTGVVIKPCVNIKFPWKLAIGDNCWIGENVWIDNLSFVEMGNSVTISQGALLITGSHDHSKETFDFKTREIRLQDGVWIGAKAIVLGGVTCTSHSILASGSVASKDLEEYMIYKGNPATPVSARVIE